MGQAYEAWVSSMKTNIEADSRTDGLSKWS